MSQVAGKFRANAAAAKRADACACATMTMMKTITPCIAGTGRTRAT